MEHDQISDPQPHRHHRDCGCAAPHPLFGLGVAAVIVAVGLLLWLLVT